MFSCAGAGFNHYFGLDNGGVHQLPRDPTEHVQLTTAGLPANLIEKLLVGVAYVSFEALGNQRLSLTG